jgi:ABC-type amino acid transport substrate-binding protein
LQLQGKEKYLLVFVDDILKQVANLKKMNFSLFPATYSDMFEQLERGTYEGVISALPPSDTAKETYVFSEPLIYLGPVLVVPKGSKATSVADMRGLMLLVPNNEELIVEVSRSPSIIIQTYANTGEALDQIRRGKADGALIPTLVAYTYTHGLYRDELKVVTPPLTDTALRLVVLAKNERGVSLLKDFNQGLKVSKENGLYYYLRRKWRLEETFE